MPPHEEPHSLRRLRESLSNLEELGRHRKELRDLWDDRCDDYAATCGTTAAACGMLRESSEPLRASVDGSALQSSRFPSGSPRYVAADPPSVSIGLAAIPSEGVDATGASRDPSPRPSHFSRSQDYSDRFRRASEEYPGLSAQRDASLATALKESQDRNDMLKRERDEAFASCASQEAEISKLSRRIERFEASEAEQLALLEERERELSKLRQECFQDRQDRLREKGGQHLHEERQTSELQAELQRTRHEQRETNERLVTLQTEAQQSRATCEELRANFERVMSDQRVQIERLEDRLREESGQHLHEERQTSELQAELQRCRHEQRETHEHLVTLQTEAQQSRATCEELRASFERVMSDQRAQIEMLEGADNRASRDCGEQSRRLSEISEALYTCLHERSALLYFIADLLATLRSLFHDPTPFSAVWQAKQGGDLLEPHDARSANWSSTPRVSSARRHRAAGGGRRCGSRGPGSVGCRPRSNSGDRCHRHSGCYACSRSPNRAAVQHPSNSHAWQQQHAHAGPFNGASADELREFGSCLERELEAISREYGHQVQRVSDEADKSARILGLRRGGGCSGIGATDETVPANGVIGACLAWIAEDRRRRNILGIPRDSLASVVDWGEEWTKYQAVTRSMEAQFEELAKLKRIIRARPSVGVRRRSRA
eukprot:TRINITY_DN3196_c0_g1_i1.p1 TRINITY_DN3196_c0_g1~~TRINITY_DN3196_c0_g1_i1.p1  ORF type:complete len:664 (+),score=129.21 TRINITY_DN3196_c0_g1_i1:79-2070(+)